MVLSFITRDEPNHKFCRRDFLGPSGEKKDRRWSGRGAGGGFANSVRFERKIKYGGNLQGKKTCRRGKKSKVQQVAVEIIDFKIILETIFHWSTRFTALSVLRGMPPFILNNFDYYSAEEYIFPATSDIIFITESGH